MSARIAVDIGGTFTDIICCPEGGPPLTRKVLSTPENFARSVVDALRTLVGQAGLEAEEVRTFVHATTVATNAVLERRGPRTGLLTTRGFRDVLEIGRLRLPVLYDLTWQKPPSLVPRRYVRELAERVDAEGSVVQALDPERAWRGAGCGKAGPGQPEHPASAVLQLSGAVQRATRALRGSAALNGRGAGEGRRATAAEVPRIDSKRWRGRPDARRGQLCAPQAPARVPLYWQRRAQES